MIPIFWNEIVNWEHLDVFSQWWMFQIWELNISSPASLHLSQWPGNATFLMWQVTWLCIINYVSHCCVCLCTHCTAGTLMEDGVGMTGRNGMSWLTTQPGKLLHFVLIAQYQQYPTCGVSPHTQAPPLNPPTLNSHPKYLWIETKQAWVHM